MLIETRPNEQFNHERLAFAPHIGLAGASGRLGRSIMRLWPDYRFTPLEHTGTVNLSSNIGEVVSGFDITNFDDVARAVELMARNGVKTVINCAGDVRVDTAEPNRGNRDSNMWKVHVDGTRNLAKAAREHGLGFIDASTEYVFWGKPVDPNGKYSNYQYLEDEGPNLDINDKTPGSTWYGITKAYGEQAALQEYPEGTIVVRFPQVQLPAGGLFMATINQLAKGVPFTRVENQLISPMSDVTAVHALSLLEAALRDKLQNGQKNPAPIYHLSSKDAFPSIEICMMLAEVLGVGEKAKRLITPTTLEELVATGQQGVIRPHNSFLSANRFKSDFGAGILQSTAQEINLFVTTYQESISKAFTSTS